MISYEETLHRYSLYQQARALDRACDIFSWDYTCWRSMRAHYAAKRALRHTEILLVTGILGYRPLRRETRKAILENWEPSATMIERTKAISAIASNTKESPKRSIPVISYLLKKKKNKHVNKA